MRSMKFLGFGRDVDSSFSSESLRSTRHNPWKVDEVREVTEVQASGLTQHRGLFKKGSAWVDGPCFVAVDGKKIEAPSTSIDQAVFDDMKAKEAIKAIEAGQVDVLLSDAESAEQLYAAEDRVTVIRALDARKGKLGTTDDD